MKASIFLILILYLTFSWSFLLTETLKGRDPTLTSFLSLQKYESKKFKILSQYSMERHFIQGFEFINDTHVFISDGRDTQIAIYSLEEPECSCSKGVISEELVHEMSDTEFGEGSTLFQGEIYMLTWKSGVVYKFDLELNEIEQLALPGEISEGWGITHDDSHLYISDGSSTIFKVDPQTFTVEDSISVVKHSGVAVDNLNELEMYNNTHIFANEWLTNYIHKIDKETGAIEHSWDMEKLYRKNKHEINRGGDGKSYDWRNNVLNGIAYRQATDTFLVGGKNWETVFEVDFKNN